MKPENSEAKRGPRGAAAVVISRPGGWRPPFLPSASRSPLATFGSRGLLLPLLLLLALATGLAQPAPVGSAGVRTLRGTIGQSYLVRMDLERNGEALTGSYAYERPGVVRPGSNRIALRGLIDAAGQVRLTESTGEDGGSAPRQTGEFVGTLTTVIVAGEPLLQFDGAWTRARDGRKMAFTLREQSLVFGGVRLTSREQREEDQPLNYSLRLALPVLGDHDSGFNRRLRTIVDPLVAGFKREVAELRRDEAGRRGEVPSSSFEIDYLIVHATPELLSLQLSIYSYTGGAHPSAQTRSLNWDLRRERELLLADLFVPGTAHGRIIADYCRRELARLDPGDPDWLARGAAFNEENYQRWNPTRAGLRITFDQYQVAAYAQGAFEVTVPWGRLKTILRAPFGQMLSVIESR